jgi:hypothetical protein
MSEKSFQPSREAIPSTVAGWDTAGLPVKTSCGLHNTTRVPYVRTSVRGPKTVGEAQPQPLIH